VGYIFAFALYAFCVKLASCPLTLHAVLVFTTLNLRFVFLFKVARHLCSFGQSLHLRICMHLR
jgi:hypothetical protein